MSYVARSNKRDYLSQDIFSWFRQITNLNLQLELSPLSPSMLGPRMEKIFSGHYLIACEFDEMNDLEAGLGRRSARADNRILTHR